MHVSKIFRNVTLLSVFCLFPSLLLAQGAGTGVDVGPGFAGANGWAKGDWTLVDTDSRVGNGGSMGRALAIGAGRNGLSISHSIGLNGGGSGVGHNFNMTIGQGGTHVSHGGVVSQGGNSRVIAGGSSQNRTWGPPQGGSTVTGFGQNTRAYSNSRTFPVYPYSAPVTYGPPTYVSPSYGTGGLAP